MAGSDTATFFGDSAWVDLGWQVPSTDAAGSVEFWTTPTRRGPLVVRSSGATWGDQRVAVYTDWMDTKYHVAFADTQHAQTDIVSASDVTFNVPTHVVVTWVSHTWTIYLNGVLDATGTQTVVPYTWGSTMYIGYGPGLTYGWAHATLDEVALYARALPASAVAAHYAARTSLPLLGSGVIAYRRDANPTLSARTGSMRIEDDVVPITQSGLAPLLDLDGIVAPTTATVASGQTIHARVQDGPGNYYDTLALYAAGADDASPLAWHYLSGSYDPQAGLTTATVSFTMPTTPGTYDLRFFTNQWALKLATSGPIMVGGPTVFITSPVAGATFGAGETVTLAAYASDYGPGITRVDFAVNGNVVTSATAPPWTGAWGTATNGTYAVTAVATDASGFVATSSAVTISISGGSSGGTPTCTVSLSPSSAAWPAAGGSSAFTVSAPGGCAWTQAQSTVPWIRTTTSGNGSGTVSYMIDPNTDPLTRSGALEIGAATFDVTQAAVSTSCTGVVFYVVGGVGSNGGNGSATVAIATGCSWTATSQVDWISVSPDSGTGPGSIQYVVNASLTGAERTGTISVAGQVLTVFQSSHTFPNLDYGMVTHRLESEYADKLQSLGAGFARLDFNWNELETCNHSVLGETCWNWGPFDNWVDQANARGQQIFATLAYTPGWANGNQSIQVPPSSIEDWYNFVYRVVQRYSPRGVKYYGMWNEPDLSGFLAGGLSAYLPLAIQGAAAVKAADPEAFVVGPDISVLGINDLPSVMSAVGSSVFDIVSFHWYPATSLSWAAAADFVHANSNGKPVWNTEVGSNDVCTPNSLAEYQQSVFYDDLLTLLQPRRSWLTKIFPYSLFSPDRCSQAITGPNWSHKKAAFFTYLWHIVHNP